MYGSKLENGSWGGILGLLQRGEIDVVAAGMVNLAEREEITSYITGIMFSKNVLFIVNPSYTGGTRSSLNFGAYLSVFTPGGWLLIGVPGGLRPGALRPGGLRPGGLRPWGIEPT